MIMNRIPHSTTKTFCDIFEDATTFVSEWEASGLYTNELDDSMENLYYLLYSRYGNSSIANLDENQFKYKCWAIIFQYGPTWQRKLSIQKSLRTMSDADLIKGSKAISSHSYAMGDDNILAYDDPTKIDQQSGTYYEKSKLEGYTMLLNLLGSDATNEFLNRFKPLFATFIYTKPDLFISEIEDEEEEEDE